VICQKEAFFHKGIFSFSGALLVISELAMVLSFKQDYGDFLIVVIVSLNFCNHVFESL
jgi:hypothetical protein